MMEQLEIEEYLEYLAPSSIRKRIDALGDIFARIAAMPYKPTTLFMSPEVWSQVQSVQQYHRRRLAQFNRRKKRKRKRGY